MQDYIIYAHKYSMPVHDSGRLNRQNTLLQIISAEVCDSQADVAQLLKERGFSVTQSLISRDFRELGIVKLDGRYLPGRRLNGGASVAQGRGMVKKAEPAGPNLIVVRTDPGAASLVADYLDRAAIAGLIGTVAGDDTVFIATSNRAAQSRVLNLLSRDLVARGLVERGSGAPGTGSNRRKSANG
jgi:transcriptional regulator of arginine metabolism